MTLIQQVLAQLNPNFLLTQNVKFFYGLTYSLKCTDQIWQNPIRMAVAAQKQFGCHVGLSLERRELEQKFQLF